MSRDGEEFKLVLFLGAAGVAFFVAGWRRWRQRRRTMDVATSNIATAAQGQVEFQGYAWPLAQELLKDIEGKPCVFRKLEIQEYVHRNKNSSWETIATVNPNHPFLIIDETGIAKIFPTGFFLNLDEITLDWSDIHIDIRRQLLLDSEKKFLGSVPPLETGFFSGSYRCVEQRILVGTPLLIHGQFTTGSMGNTIKLSQSFHDFYNQLKSKKDYIYKQADKNLDGQVCANEAIDTLHSLAMHSIRKSTDGELREVKICGSVTKHDIYDSFFANCHQEHLIKRLGTWDMLGIWGGVALIVAAIIVALTLMHVDVFSSPTY